MQMSIFRQSPSLWGGCNVQLSRMVQTGPWSHGRRSQPHGTELRNRSDLIDGSQLSKNASFYKAQLSGHFNSCHILRGNATVWRGINLGARRYEINPPDIHHGTGRYVVHVKRIHLNELRRCPASTKVGKCPFNPTLYQRLTICRNSYVFHVR